MSPYSILKLNSKEALISKALMIHILVMKSLFH